MTRDIKGMITMKKSNLLTDNLTGTLGGSRTPSGALAHAITATLALALAGCATSGGGGKQAREPLPDEVGSNGAAATERETISSKQAEQIIPKEKKRNISADARADFEKAMKRYQEAKKEDGLSKSECSSVADAFKSVAQDNPGLTEARFNQGAVLYECGRDDEAARIWEGMKYGPAITNLGYIAWKNNERDRAESLFKRAIDEDPLHSVEARNNMAQIQRDKARRASSSEEKKNYVSQAVSNLRTVLALDSNNLQAFSTLAFIYYDMNMLEMAKLVGNQAIKKAEEIATGKFEEEKVEEANEKAAVKGGKGKKKEKKEKAGGGDEDEAAKPKEIGREAGTGVTGDMKKQLAVVHNTLGLVELKKKNISPAIKQFKEAATLNPNFAEARMNLAALSLNNRDYLTAEENFRAVIKLQPKNFEAAIGLGVALRGNKKIEEAEAQYNSAKGLDPSQGASYFNLGLLYQEYKDGQKPSLQKAQDYYRQFLGHTSSGTSESLKKEAEKRIKDIDEIYVALAEAEKMQAEAEAMQKKAEEQQKQMEEEMKKQEAAEKAAADKAAADKAGGDAKKAGGDKGAGDKAAPASGGDKGAAPGADAAGKTEGAADDKAAAPAAGGKKGKKKK
jgi:Tfp pilus assembly protein PilF